MKSIFSIIFVLSTCIHSPSSKKHKFSIDIWDYNYSMSYTMHYKIDDDSLRVIAIDNIQGGRSRNLINRKMAENEKQSIAEFLSNFPFESLDSLYINPLVNDGDQKKIIILFENKRKVIDVENVYQKDIDSLIVTVNKLLSYDARIMYNK